MIRYAPLAAFLLLSPGLAHGQVVGPCAGTYIGTWHNNTFNTTGPLVARVEVGNVMVAITFDAGGSVFGGGDPPAATIVGPDVGQSWTGSATGLPVYGDVTATINSAGLVTVSGTNVPGTLVQGYGATGTLTACNLHLNGQISLRPMGTATTVIDANRFCYPNCDQSTNPPTLNILDFNCFLNRYTAGHPYANCDGSTNPPVLNILDFNCFLNRYTQGCP
jgi:hypothetical protein